MYKEAGLEDSFYGVMRRLTEMLYTGVRLKVQSGYTTDFNIARASLANMLMLARDCKVYLEGVELNGEQWQFSVVATQDHAEAVKAGISAMFISESDVTVNAIAGKRMVFALSEDMINSGLLTVAYRGYTVNLSVETLIETAEVEALTWATVDANATTTYHSAYYSNGAEGTTVNSELVTLSAENKVGDRASGNYFHVSPSSTSDTSNIGFSVLPTELTKEDVLQYSGKAVLKFDVYLENVYIADGTERVGQKIWYSLGKSTNSSHRTNEWFTVSIDFAQIAQHWDTLMDTSAKTYQGGINDNWSTSWRALFAVNGASHSAEGNHTTSFYIGNFRIAHS
jgi:hypothetical protein